MMKFQGIEGLRAWLSWTVFFHHLILFTGCGYLFVTLAKLFSKAGDYSVLIFIVISGFVITHLLLTKKETYKLYIVRRFLRLYPVYIVSLLLGILGTYLWFKTFSGGGAQLHMPVSIERFNDQYLSFTTNFYEHLIAHITMLHGLISNNILYESQYMFLSPAWSLSLEWQFYLIAPFVIWMVTKSAQMRLSCALIFVLLFTAYQKGYLGSFILPSALPQVYFLFAFGIFCRFNYEAIIKNFYSGLCAFILLIPFMPMKVFLPCLLFYVFICLCNMPNNPITKLINLLFLNKFINVQGARSYCVYLIHAPIIQITFFCAVTYLNSSQKVSFFITAFLAIPITFLLSAFISKYIEKPAISYGKKLQFSNSDRVR